MVGVYLDDGTSIHFIPEYYHMHFENLAIFFYRKKEFALKNRPKTIVIDYGRKRFSQLWEDGQNVEQSFTGVM